MAKKIEVPIYNIIWHLELGFNCCLCFSLILRFILSKRMSKPAVLATVDKNDTVSNGFIWFHSKMKP